MTTKYLLVNERPNLASRFSQPIVLEIIRETDHLFVTRDMYSIGLRDLLPKHWKTNTVRWSKRKSVRAGDGETQPHFQIRKILQSLEGVDGRTIVILANGIHQFKKEKHA
jgi:hypothetical protein